MLAFVGEQRTSQGTGLGGDTAAPVRPHPGVAGRGAKSPGGPALSRTDAHAPLWVRLARVELAAEAIHAPDHVDCDLPARPPAIRPPWRPTTKCYWTFRYTGTAICSCWMCHSGWEARRSNRIARQRHRVSARAALRRWRQGDEDAFDDLTWSDPRSFW